MTSFSGLDVYELHIQKVSKYIDFCLQKYELVLSKNLIITCIKELITFYKSSCFVTCANRCFQEAIDIYVVPAREKNTHGTCQEGKIYIVKVSAVQYNILYTLRAN